MSVGQEVYLWWGRPGHAADGSCDFKVGVCSVVASRCATWMCHVGRALCDSIDFTAADSYERFLNEEVCLPVSVHSQPQIMIPEHQVTSGGTESGAS
jgi:hypothetical protein